MSTTPPPPPPPPPSNQPPLPPAGGGAPVPGAPGTPVPAPGPIGKRRSKLLVILLSIVTFGIWTWVWSYQNGDELQRRTGTGLGGTAYLLIMVSNVITLGISGIVVMFLMAGEVEQMYRREGREPRITTIWGLWFLLPIIGNLIWYIRIQNAINEYWTVHGATDNPGL